MFRRSFNGAFCGVDAVYLPFLRRVYAEFTPSLYGGGRRVVIMAICKLCGADRKLMNGGVCSPCLRAIPPKDNRGVTPAPAPALVERDSGIVDALKAQSESIEDLVTSIEADRLERISAASLGADDEDAPASSEEEGAGIDWGSSFMTAVCIVIALFGAVFVYGLYRFTHAPPIVAPVNGSVREYIS